MKHKLCDIPSLITTPIGRRELRRSLFHVCWPIISCAASFYRRTYIKKTRVVAVVGSLGKSTTTRAVSTALGSDINKLSQRNALSFLGRAILRIRPDDQHAVIEVGIDGIGQMRSYARMILPDITVVTSIGNDHHRSLGSLEVTRREKSEMVRILPKTGIAVLNGDDSNVRLMKEETSARIITFGIDDINDIRASAIQLDWPNGTRFKLHAEGKTYNMRVRLIGRHMIYPVLAGVAVGLTEGISIDCILSALEALAPTPGRMQPVRLANGAIIIRDDYKSGLETMEAALDLFSEVPAKRRIVVFGDVTEPKGRYGLILQHLGERIGKISSKSIFYCHTRQACAYTVGAVCGGLSRSAIINTGTNVFKVIDELRDNLKDGDVVLIKGRDVQRLQRVTLALTGRKVSCNIPFCEAKATICEYCPMLERGWDSRKLVKMRKV